MKRAPFRVLFFLAAIVALGVYAAAVTIPHLFTAGDRIVAAEVNANFATLAAAVEAAEAPREVVVSAPALTIEEYGSPTSVETTQDGRWQVSYGFEGFALCGSDVEVRYFLLIDHVPVASTVVFASENQTVRTRLAGPTERVLPAGEHQLNVGIECVGSETVAVAVIDADDVHSIVVLPE